MVISWGKSPKMLKSNSPMLDKEQKKQVLRELLQNMTILTGEIQAQMSCVLLENKSVRKKVEKLSNQSENDAIEMINNAMYGFISAMPIASLNFTNIFMNTIAHHSKMTGDPTMMDMLQEIGDEIGKENLDESYKND